MNWISYHTRRVPRYLRRMGYVRELKELGRRRDRCRAAWQPHLDRTRALILEAAAACPCKDSVLIVGSGLLFDIPLRELADQFHRVILADIVQMWPAHRLANAFDNVELVECDISGAVEPAYRCALAGTLPDMSTVTVDRFHDGSFDLVVSANILSQLPVLPNAFLSRRVDAYTTERMIELSRRLVEDHLDWLGGFESRTCLIADLERLYCKNERVISREPSLWGARLPDGYRDWYWDLAPRPEFNFRHDVRHRVAGYVNFPAQNWRSSNSDSTSRPIDVDTGFVS